ncbi:tetratricopeptide repeat protein [Panacibacter ginsenosidivorans]|uniref:Tetratricopeptide repeat protein n=1 Tax=Panacibacter ginsenosidivorans TaxID=1813871 RepID=A0A5B8V7X8_9BACT|nr:tetratricopeptide repeat protein [Panacibacter ginsenosidivorans]QEC67003.1 tetratricopeptide repeat protein [Panacibacter ginsenosidivorans]
MDRIQKLLDFLQTSPNDNFLKHALALEYIKINDPAKARSLFEEILTKSPDYVGSYYQLAKLLEQTGEKENAITWYEKGMVAAKKAGDDHAYKELQSAYEDLVY